MKTCQLGLPIQCQYQTINSGAIPCGCNFIEFCDYQLPRDSRRLTLKKLKDEYGINPEEANMI